MVIKIVCLSFKYKSFRIDLYCFPLVKIAFYSYLYNLKNCMLLCGKVVFNVRVVLPPPRSMSFGRVAVTQVWDVVNGPRKWRFQKRAERYIFTTRDCFCKSVLRFWARANGRTDEDPTPARTRRFRRLSPLSIVVRTRSLLAGLSQILSDFRDGSS